MEAASSSSSANAIPSESPAAIEQCSMPAATDSNDIQNDTQSASSPNQKRSHKKRKSSNARLRKLWRRATTTPQGILSRAEWEELMELHTEWKTLNSSTDNGDQGKDKYADVLPGPSVSIKGEMQRDFRKTENWQSSKVSDHRDILVNLLFGCNANKPDGNNAPNKKKRKKDELESNGKYYSHQQKINVPSLPTWANISNLAGMGGVAVIELDINDPDTEQSDHSLMPSQFLQQPNSIWEAMLENSTESVTKGDKHQVKRVIGAACKVKMFQGDYPRCISDELMFLPPPSLSKLENKNNAKDLFQAIQSLRLPQKQMQSEGFPRRVGGRVKVDEGSELHSKIELAKEKVCTKAASFWQQFTPDGKQLDKALKNDDSSLELVECLSIRETVCCSDEETTPNEDEFSTSEFYVHTLLHTLLHDKERSPKVFALDCEMVQTAAGPELARVSVVLLLPDDSGQYSIDESDEKSTVVLDELVKPRRPVLDYLTEYSGITPTMLQEVKTRIEDVQVMLLSLIQETDVIVGHSLENDLKALRLLHLNVVDTSMVFRGSNGRKYGLRHLTNVLLKRQIQSSAGGHCSTEDAEAALILATRRAKLGPAFQLKENSRGKSIMGTFQSINRGAGEGKESFAERSDGPCVCIGSNEWIMKYQSKSSHHVLSCDSILNSMSMAIPSWLHSSSSRKAGFLWANLSCGNTKASANSNRGTELKKLEEIMTDIYRRVPLHTPILLICQHNYAQALALTKERKLALKSTITWSTEKEQKWKSCMNASMNCEALWIVGVPV